MRRTATSGGDSDDDSDSEESDDEEDDKREAIVLSQPVELTQDESSQEPEPSQGEVPPEPYSQQGPSGVRVEGFNPAALRDRIMTAAARAPSASLLESRTARM